MLIYVSGAPGNVGTELVRRLSARGEQVRVLVHTAKAADLLKLPGVETVVGDLAEAASLEGTLEGVAGVFVNSSVGPAIQAQKNLIEAAKRAGARRIVKLSWMGASEDAFTLPIARWHAEVERHLKDAGVSYTILRANTFMQTYLYQITHTSEDAFHGAAGEGTCSLVDARDVAAVAARTLLDAGHEGETYEVTGPEALTRAQAADIISRVSGRQLRYVNRSAEEMAEGYQQAGWPEPWADELVAIDELQAQGYLSLVTSVVEKVTRKKPVTFEEFVREFMPPAAARK
jgi:uncharacterized protein YbjT (DUF2867 family)